MRSHWQLHQLHPQYGDKECRREATPAHTPGKSLEDLMEKNLTISAVY